MASTIKIFVMVLVAICLGLSLWGLGSYLSDQTRLDMLGSVSIETASNINGPELVNVDTAVLDTRKSTKNNNRSKHRIALYLFWWSPTGQFRNNFADMVDSICKNADLFDVYFLSLSDDASDTYPNATSPFETYLCDNFFLSRMAGPYFFSAIAPLFQSHMTEDAFNEMRSRQDRKIRWQLGFIRPCFASIIEFLYPGLWQTYSHWGYLESDVQLGQVSKFLTPHILDTYDVTSSREWTWHFYPIFIAGQMGIFRNVPFLTKLWQPAFRVLTNITAANDVTDESLFSDCVLSNSVPFAENKTNSDMMWNPFMAAYRSQCGLPSHNPTQAERETASEYQLTRHNEGRGPQFFDTEGAQTQKFFTAAEAADCKKFFLSPTRNGYLSVRWIRAIVNEEYGGHLLYKGRMFAAPPAIKKTPTQDPCDRPTHMKKVKGLTLPKIQTKTLTDLYVISGTVKGAFWVKPRYRAGLANAKVSSEDFSFEGGVSYLHAPGSSELLAYVRNPDGPDGSAVFESPVLGNLTFEKGGMSVPEFWLARQCLNPVMFYHTGVRKDPTRG